MRPTSFQSDITFPQSIDRCGYYGRVSTPKQKLEHQREHVLRFTQENGIHLPPEMMFEDKEKRHKSAKREEFQRLLEISRQGRLDWIIICSFDRWGIADVDEFFEFRRQLLKSDVQLWSVVDNMNLTSLNEGDYFRIVAMAVGATKYVESMAEKNILKMIEMANRGWATTGNAPYGLDLVCYPLHDLNKPMFRVVRMRQKPRLIKIIHADGKVELTDRMPPRDKKATGYRYAPSLEEDRLRAVNLMYELYDSGMGFREISRSLWDQGYKHYDKPFGYHGVETILLNPAYIGLPAWGKVGVGAYRVVLDQKPTKPKRKSTDTVVIRKDESQYIQPAQPLFDPVVPKDLWDRVHRKLTDRERTNPQFGKRKRSRTIHPLNGKLICPDCNERMVQGSYCPRDGKRTHCFHCGTYRKFSRLKCFSNTVPWAKLDAAVEELLRVVDERIASVTEKKADEGLLKEEWLRQTELGKTVLRVVESLPGPVTLDGFGADEVAEAAQDHPAFFSSVFAEYDRNFNQQAAGFRGELDEIEREIQKIGGLLMEVPSDTLKKQWFRRLGELEDRKKAIEPLLVPLTAKASAIVEQLAAIRQTIANTDKTRLAELLDTFVEKVVPRFDVKIGKDKVRRAHVRAFEFFPRETARHIMPESMEIGAAPAATSATRATRASAPRRRSSATWPRSPGRCSIASTCTSRSRRCRSRNCRRRPMAPPARRCATW